MSYKKKLVRAGCVLALFGTPFAVHAQAVTFDFTGVVNSVYGTTGATDGMPVTGTYTFDFANANPVQSSPPYLIGSTALNWGVINQGGGIFSPPPTPPVSVFWSTAQVGTLSYSSVAGGPYASSSGISGSVGPPANTYQFYAAEQNYTTSSAAPTGSGLILGNPSQSVPAWTSDGLPVLVSGQGPSDGFFYSGQIAIGYEVTSLTRVPEPGNGWLLLMGLGGLGVLARRRHPSPV